jgi:hypothetical protein
MRNRLARQLVRFYPRAWRARYEDELVAMLDARENVGWDDVFDLSLGATREWARWLLAWPTHEPAGDLKALGRETRAEMLLLVVGALAINFVGRGIASEITRFIKPDFPGLAALLWIQAAAALRVSLTKLWWRTERDDAIRVRELAIWSVAIGASAVLAHLDPGLAALPRTTWPWWERFATTPVFGIWIPLYFLTQGTPMARARFRRMRELEEIRLRDSVPPNPLGIKPQGGRAVSP